MPKHKKHTTHARGAEAHAKGAEAHARGAKAHARSPEGKTIITWIAPEYISHRKSTKWYVIAGTVVAAVIAFAFIYGNWTMALAVIVFTAVYQLTHTYHPPKNIKISVTELGIRVGHMFFPYSHIQAFWIFYKPGLQTLNLRVAKNFWSDIIVQLNDQDPVEVRSYLVGQVPEWEGKDERLGDLFLRLLRL